MLPEAASTLPKKERLNGKKDISALLAGGKWGSVGCLRFCSLSNSLDYSRIMVSVPKRLFKRAVKRNLLKRRIREAYRTGKHQLDSCPQDILFQYISPEIADFREISLSVDSILKKLAK